MAIPQTDIHRWRLKVDLSDGGQTWHYLKTEKQLKEWPQTFYDRYWLGIHEKEDLPKATTAIESARNGFRFFQKLQTEDGHWAGEYGGPMFLIGGLTIAMHVTGAEYPPGYKEEIIRYLMNRAHPEDGGWGIHIESDSTVFGTSLNYVALRLLGVDRDHPVMIKARGLLHKLGGAIRAPAWGKFWLAVLNVYEWEGMNPVPTELWLLPYILPIHPARMWIHCRQVYLAMGYLYCKRFKGPDSDLIQQIREEIYVTSYEDIQWSRHRNDVAEVDVYCPHTKIHDFLFGKSIEQRLTVGILAVYEKFPIKFIRDKSLKVALEHINAEDRNTDYADLGPVNKVMNMIIVWLEEGPKSKGFQRHLERNLDFMWMGPEGLRMNGTNGSQLWDTAFACQALAESGLANEKEFQQTMISALGFLDRCQIKENSKEHEKYYRHIAKGAWPFSTRTQSYTVSDCTAEGLKTTLILQNKLKYVGKRISDDRLKDAVDVLLSLKNPNGGYASYETVRGPAWLEWLNPAEVFGNIMIEYTYTECTTAVLLGLSYFRKYFPDYRQEEVKQVCAIDDAVRYIKNVQREDGSWFGCWAICFTYAMFFGIEALSSVGETYDNSPHVRKACDFLISKQREDGGWGERYKACEVGEWVENEKSQVVNTSWAVLSLLAAKYPHQAPIQKAVELIMSRQQPNGEWLQESIEGVFNKNCMISYPNYKFYFCIWALGRYHNAYSGKRQGITFK